MFSSFGSSIEGNCSFIDSTFSCCFILSGTNMKRQLQSIYPALFVKDTIRQQPGQMKPSIAHDFQTWSTSTDPGYLVVWQDFLSFSSSVFVVSVLRHAHVYSLEDPQTCSCSSQRSCFLKPLFLFLCLCNNCDFVSDKNVAQVTPGIVVGQKTGSEAAMAARPTSGEDKMIDRGAAAEAGVQCLVRARSRVDDNDETIETECVGSVSIQTCRIRDDQMLVDKRGAPVPIPGKAWTNEQRGLA